MYFNSVDFFCAAIALLQDKQPGTFVIRDSQSYTGAFGLAIKVEVPPMHVIQNQNKDFGKPLLQHFLDRKPLNVLVHALYATKSL